MICRICSNKIEHIENIEDIKTDVNRYYQVPTKLKRIDVQFGYCTRCDFGQIDYMLDENFYDEYLMSENIDNDSADRGVSTYYENYYSDILSRMHEMSDGKSLLDIGCGVGTFLGYSIPYFEEVHGIEPSEKACIIAQKRGFDVENKYFDDNYDKHGFSAITATQVLEHLDNPRNIVESIYKSLKWGGVVYVDVPNGQRIYQKSRYYDVYMEHINYWSIYALSKIFAEQGFTIVEVKQIHTGNHIMLLACKEKQHVFFSVVRESHLCRLTEVLKKYHNVSIWGCGVKGSVFLRGIKSEKIKYFFDSDNQLAGKYIDGFGIQVSLPDKNKISENELILVTATEHKFDIKYVLRDLYEFKGDIISIDEI